MQISIDKKLNKIKFPKKTPQKTFQFLNQSFSFFIYKKVHFSCGLECIPKMLKRFFKISCIPLTLKRVERANRKDKENIFRFISNCARVHCIDAIIVFRVHLTGTQQTSLKTYKKFQY